MTRPKTDRSEHYTYEDYLTWDGPERWELIDGVPYLLASPTAEHQEISARLEHALQTHLRDGECRMYHAPMDLRFEEDLQTERFVQPDIFVMCGTYTRGASVTGVPRLIVEILSPSSVSNDLVRKLNLYQRAGVPEYWVVDPAVRTIHVYHHDGTFLRWIGEYAQGTHLPSVVFEGLQIEIRDVFA